MEINNNYNEKPSLGQLTHMVEVLKSKNIALDDKLWANNFNGITIKQYKYILALAYENKTDKLKELIKKILTI